MSMKISVIGAAGYVGSNVAFMLAVQKLCEEVILIDPFKPNIVTHLGIDASTALVDNDVKLRPGEYSDMVGSSIVVVTAGAAQGLIKSRMEMLPKNLPIIKEIAGNIVKYAPDAIVLTATNPVDPLNYAMYKFTGFERNRVIGYTINDTTRFRETLAELLGQRAADISAFVLGEHGETQVLAFSTVKVKGKPVVISEELKKKVVARISQVFKTLEELQTGRTAGITSSVGAARVINAIVKNTNETLPCSAVLDGEYGLKNISLGVPIVFGASGIQKVREIELAADEKPKFEKTVKAMSEAARVVDAFIKEGK